MNEWNATVHVPQAVLMASEDDGGTVAHIVFQAWLPHGGRGPGRRCIDVVPRSAISGACLFWQGVTGENDPEADATSS